METDVPPPLQGADPTVVQACAPHTSPFPPPPASDLGRRQLGGETLESMGFRPKYCGFRLPLLLSVKLVKSLASGIPFPPSVKGS